MVGDIGSATDWNAALEGVELVVHAAARAHDVSGTEADNEGYLETNARGSRRIAEAAARVGVRRLLYLSSIKVNGEVSAGGGFSLHRLLNVFEPPHAVANAIENKTRRCMDARRTSKPRAAFPANASSALGLETLDPEMAIDVVTGTGRAWEPGPILSNSFGFGGHNGCLVIAPPPQP